MEKCSEFTQCWLKRLYSIIQDFAHDGCKEYEREYSPPPDDILNEYLDDDELNDTVETNKTKQENIKQV